MQIVLLWVDIHVSLYGLWNRANPDFRFLWAKFQLIDIREALTEEAIRKTLANLPKTLSEIYLRIIHKTYSSPGGEAKFHIMCAAFRWISVARRPLRLDELEEAVSLRPEDTYLHTDRIPRDVGGRLMSACGNLAVYDEEENTVSFAHHTVKQFLLSSQQHENVIPSIIDLKRGEEDVGNMCLAYLGFSDFET